MEINNRILKLYWGNTDLTTKKQCLPQWVANVQFAADVGVGAVFSLLQRLWRGRQIRLTIAFLVCTISFITNSMFAGQQNQLCNQFCPHLLKKCPCVGDVFVAQLECSWHVHAYIKYWTDYSQIAHLFAE